MEQAREEVESLGGSIVAIFQYRPEPTRNFCRKRGVEFECLGDPTREAYREVGLDRYKPGSFVGPQLAKGLVRAARKGSLPGVPKGDVAQAPGTFVVAPGGKVAFAHYNEDSSDNPPMDEVLSAVRAASSAR